MVDSRSVRLMELDRRRAAWPQIAQEIRRRIEGGQYPAGSAVPSTVALSAEFEVSTSTMRRALVRLIEEGTLWAEPGMGTYVADDEKPPAS